ncbi:hypothetical protein [Actinoplanes sp. NPDC026623]|uniref:hypothetical protein n=1 Tax=Actinoplanes sp. NPDC026623 TaxID=3155610 RepID=UPI0033E3677F
MDYLPNPSEHLGKILISQRPLITHRVVAATWPMVFNRYSEDEESVLKAITGFYPLVARALSTHEDVARTRVELMSGPDDERALRLVSHLYRLSLETNFRHTAAAVLCMLGETELTTELPSTNDLLMGISRSSSDICQFLKKPVRTEWRNAAAHEHVYWDDSLDAPVLGGQVVKVEEIHQAAESLIAIDEAFQAGIAIARAGHAVLRRRIDQFVNPWEGSPFLRNRVAEILGVAGVAPHDVRRRRDTVHVHIPNLAGREFQALVSIVVAAEESDWIDAYWVVTSSGQTREWRLDRASLVAAASIAPGGAREGAGTSWSSDKRPTMYRPWSALPLIAVDLANTDLRPVRMARKLGSVVLTRLSQYCSFDSFDMPILLYERGVLEREMQTAVVAVRACADILPIASHLEPIISAIDEALRPQQMRSPGNIDSVITPILRLQEVLGDVDGRYSWFVEA